jgi:hypothetical protein
MRARNLLSKADCRSTDADEVVHGWPKVPLVIEPCSATCRAERLARRRSCPDGLVVGPPCKSKRIAPDADASEEVALGVSGNVIGSDVSDVSLIYISRCNHVGVDQVAQPLSAVRVDLVVVGYRFSHG